MPFFRRRRPLLTFLAAFGLLNGLCLLAAGPLLLGRHVGISATPAMTLAEVRAYAGEGRRGPVRIQAYLSGVDLPQMPGASGGQVVGGRLVVTVRATRDASANEDSAITHTVYAWEAFAPQFLLSDQATGDGIAVPLAADPRQLPLASADGPFPQLVTEQGGDRPRPLRVTYDGLTFPVDQTPFAGLRQGDALSAQVERYILRDGEAVTVVGDVVAGPSGGRVVPATNGELAIYRGTIGWNTLGDALGLALCLPILGLVLIVGGSAGLFMRRWF